MSGPQGPFDPQLAAEHPIDPQLRVGHVHLRTADIDRVRDFYVGIMGFDVMFQARDVPGWGPPETSCFSRPAATTTISASTPGSRRAARRSLTGSPGCTTWR